MSSTERLVRLMRVVETRTTEADASAVMLSRQYSELKKSNPIAAAALMNQHGNEIMRGRELAAATPPPEPPAAA